MAKKRPQASSVTGNGGETHQRNVEKVLTTNHGVPVSDNQNSLKSGARGPTLLEDFVLREKIFHFDHERIPERIVHARGSGAHGILKQRLTLPASPKRRFSRKAKRLKFLSASQPSPVELARLIHRETCADLLLSFTRVKATGIS